LPASTSSKQLGAAARVPCGYKREPNLMTGYLHGRTLSSILSAGEQTGSPDHWVLSV
jgi:hypothetical protein